MIRHLPVMLREVIEILKPVTAGIYVDATLGLGGHAMEILRLIGPEGVLVGIDRDDEALRMAEERLNDRRAVLLKGSFSDVKELLFAKGIKEADGILFDFGVSMMQFKEKSRGFSFASEELLDMRMDRSQKITAGDIVNAYHEKDIEKILREYGEEWRSVKIARAITDYRAKKKITTCAELAGIVENVAAKRGRLHPATKTFQALRIAVNDEINEIHKGLEASIGVLRTGGRLCTISYHSLEDRIAKRFMKNAEKEGLVRVITKKPLHPSYDEVRANPSSRSAKLRGAEKL